MTKKDFQGLDIAATNYKIDEHYYQLCHYISYRWQIRSPQPQYSEVGFTKHPTSNWNIFVGFNKDVIETVNGVEIRLNILAYFTYGPTGHRCEISGKIGETKIYSRSIRFGAGGIRGIIEIISIDRYIFNINYSLDYFSLAMLGKCDQ